MCQIRRRGWNATRGTPIPSVLLGSDRATPARNRAESSPGKTVWATYTAHAPIESHRIPYPAGLCSGEDYCCREASP